MWKEFVLNQAAILLKKVNQGTTNQNENYEQISIFMLDLVVEIRGLKSLISQEKYKPGSWIHETKTQQKDEK